jgi:hypothetical protein
MIRNPCRAALSAFVVTIFVVIGYLDHLLWTNPFLRPQTSSLATSEMRCSSTVMDDQNYESNSIPNNVMARAFTWNKQTLPCFPPDFAMSQKYGYRSRIDRGFIFMKLIKVGGSTATGVTMRIAKHEAERRRAKYWICRGRWDHSYATQMFPERVRDISFTWTILRDPTKCVIRDFFPFRGVAEKKFGVGPILSKLSHERYRQRYRIIS